MNMILRRGLFFLVIGMSLSAQARAEPVVRADFPSKGSMYWPPPDGVKNAPLLVVLHGDAPGGKTPLVKRDSEPFVKAAAARGIAVLAPMCPKDEGCLVGSYWQWSQGDPPGWIDKQVEAVRKESSLDPDRIWLAGWSGGASFLGYHYSRWADRYAAVVFAGGGIAPYSSTCAPCSPPAYFMVGNKNPLHHLAKELKAGVSSCTQDVTWDLQPGSDHAGEWRALNRPGKVGDILDWLENHPRFCGKTVAPSASASTPPAPVASSIASAAVQLPPMVSARAENAASTVDSTRPVGRPVREKRSGCSVSAGDEGAGGDRAGWLGFLGVFWALGQRHAKRRMKLDICRRRVDSGARRDRFG